MSARYQLKRRRGFFAAGTEFEQALRVLSDGAFKLYAYVCLQAERATGRLVFERAELALQLGKSRSALGRHLRELVRAGVCELQTAPNQHRGSVLAVQAAYWPYRALGDPPPACPQTDRTAYVEAVRETFLGPACVQADFGPADERLASDWHAAGVSLQTVRRAILLGCVRKSMALIERPGARPVARLAYFEPLLREVQRERFPAAYWQHLRFNLGRCEDYWQHEPAHSPGRARPNLEQAGRSSSAADPSRPSTDKQGETR
ncbi:MAG: hypothetical protein OXN96_03325 [Bryobacterales bacterium]|nr:hypothetical protein [Bryobacterales bacterium]